MRANSEGTREGESIFYFEGDLVTWLGNGQLDDWM